MSNASLYSLKKCPCGEDYYGHQCSIPGCVYKVSKNRKFIVTFDLHHNSTVFNFAVHKKSKNTNFSEHLPYQLLSHARRVVMAFPVNHEFDMTEIRFADTVLST